jgi:acetyl-CoA acyltransferase 1
MFPSKPSIGYVLRVSWQFAALRTPFKRVRAILELPSVWKACHCSERTPKYDLRVSLLHRTSPRPTPTIAESVNANSQAQDACQPMGWTSEMVAQDYGVSREKQDEYALISHTRAARAAQNNIFRDEIIPIDLNGKLLFEDDTVRIGVTAESLSSLKPVFPDWGRGTTTAGNASGVGDGAGLLILASRSKAEREGLQILGKWVSSVVVGVEPRHMGVGPIVAIPKLMEKTGLTKEDVDIFEVRSFL